MQCGAFTYLGYSKVVVRTIMDAEIEFSGVWYLPVFGLPPGI